jgi:hypothetical protein
MDTQRLSIVGKEVARTVQTQLGLNEITFHVMRQYSDRTLLSAGGIINQNREVKGYVIAPEILTQVLQMDEQPGRQSLQQALEKVVHQLFKNR